MEEWVATDLFQLWEPNEIISKRQTKVAINWCFSLLLSLYQGLASPCLHSTCGCFDKQALIIRATGTMYAVVPDADALG